MNTPDLTPMPGWMAGLSPIICALAGVAIAYIRYRDRAAARAERRSACASCRAKLPEDPPSVDGAGVILMMLFAGASWLWLVGAPQRLAHYVMPAALQMDAKSGPVDRSCSKSSDCGSGCSCDRGQCSCSARQPRSAPPQRQQPRRVAVLHTGTLCADCQALPWHTLPIATFYSPPSR